MGVMPKVGGRLHLPLWSRALLGAVFMRGRNKKKRRLLPWIGLVCFGVLTLDTWRFRKVPHLGRLRSKVFHTPPARLVGRLSTLVAPKIDYPIHILYLRRGSWKPI